MNLLWKLNTIQITSVSKSIIHPLLTIFRKEPLPRRRPTIERPSSDLVLLPIGIRLTFHRSRLCATPFQRLFKVLHHIGQCIIRERWGESFLIGCLCSTSAVDGTAETVVQCTSLFVALLRSYRSWRRYFRGLLFGGGRESKWER